MTELAPGQSLASRFELIRLLGQGGMGQVWLATDAELGGEVAVKVLDQRLVHRPGMLDLLRHECRQARRLVHPNIVRIYDFHQDGEHAFITMEYVAGGELGRLRDARPSEILRKPISPGKTPRPSNGRWRAATSSIRWAWPSMCGAMI